MADGIPGESEELQRAAQLLLDAAHAPSDPRSRTSVTGLGSLAAFVGAAGMAAAIALLYQGMATVMETAGGFVATGGPYAIAHPAPDWIWIMPGSIFVLIIFGGVSI